MPENRNWKGRVSVNVILIMSAFWVIYGIAGILGFQVIRSEYRGHDWTKTYVRLLGVSWLLLGVPWLLFDRIAVHTAANIGTGLLCIILLALAMPSIVFTFFIDKDTALCFMRRCFFDPARNRNKLTLSEQGCPFLSAFHDFDSGIFPPRAQTIPEYGKKERWGCKSCCQFLFI